MLGKNVVLIDDCLDYTAVLKKNLEREGFKIKSFKHPVAGLDYVKENYAEVDLILLDLMMPELSGLEFLSALKESKNKSLFKFKICVLSDKHDLLEIETSFKLGANEYFLKSENIEILVERIYEFMEITKHPVPDQDKEFISLLEITNIIHDFQVVEFDENNVILYSREELPIHSTIQINSEKLKKYKQTNMPINCIVDNCEILDERVLITCQYLDQAA
ncbi:response regulator [Halobacteriovorax sp. JY17]|uniref:response regulator n=1 Tax=Halobacteriovorax sp. JY17 TaxID=2014617 RepID=UPI0025BEC802|nr:response regulator [Halobacteriovorax sp. JY17]